MYEGFFKLAERPFQLLPDPRRVYHTPGHERGLSYLIYGVERGEGIVIVTGDVGTGKTLLVQVLLDEISTDGLMIARVAMANANAKTAMASVAAAFGVNVRDMSKVELQDALIARLSGGRARRGLLIVDEAQACSDDALEELRLLSNLQSQGRALLQVVLVGQTDLRDRLRGPAMSPLRQRVVASYHLHPLSRDEVAGYIEHRLETAGWQPEHLAFEAGVYDRVHEWSRGIPRRVNQIMDRLLLFGFIEEYRTLTVEDLDVVIQEFEEEFGADGLVFDAAAADAMSDDDGTSAGEVAQPEPAPSIYRDLLARIDALENAVTQAAGADRLAWTASRTAEREAAAAWVRLEALEAFMRETTPAADASNEPVEAPAERDAPPAEPPRPPGETAHAGPRRPPSSEDISAVWGRLFGDQDHD